VEVEVDKEAEQKMLEYMLALEKTNEQLVKALKLCVEGLDCHAAERSGSEKVAEHVERV
jgi:hypothetical protein